MATILISFFLQIWVLTFFLLKVVFNFIFSLFLFKSNCLHHAYKLLKLQTPPIFVSFLLEIWLVLYSIIFFLDTLLNTATRNQYTINILFFDLFFVSKSSLKCMIGLPSYCGHQFSQTFCQCIIWKTTLLTLQNSFLPTHVLICKLMALTLLFFCGVTPFPDAYFCISQKCLNYAVIRSNFKNFNDLK